MNFYTISSVCHHILGKHPLPYKMVKRPRSGAIKSSQHFMLVRVLICWQGRIYFGTVLVIIKNLPTSNTTYIGSWQPHHHVKLPNRSIIPLLYSPNTQLHHISPKTCLLACQFSPPSPIINLTITGKPILLLIYPKLSFIKTILIDPHKNISKIFNCSVSINQFRFTCRFSRKIFNSLICLTIFF